MIDWKAAARGFRDRWRDADQAGMTLARENVRLRSELAESTARADRLAAEVSELRAAGDAMAERLAYQHPECDRSVCAAAREAETWRALGVVGEE